MEVAGQVFIASAGPKKSEKDLALRYPSVLSVVLCILYLRGWSVERLAHRFHMNIVRVKDRLHWTETVRRYL